MIAGVLGSTRFQDAPMVRDRYNVLKMAEFDLQATPSSRL